jgi:ribosome-associated translation inhibitor RaiA
MQIPLRVASRDFTLPPWADGLVRERADRLEGLHPRLLGCQVTVAGPSAHHGRIGFQVRIRANVAPRPLVVTHQHDDDLAVAIDQAFDALTRQLTDDVRVHRGR